MKKSVKSLLIMLAVLVVVGGGAALLLLTPVNQEETTSAVSSEAGLDPLVQLTWEDLSAIRVENSQGRFTIGPVNAEEFKDSESGSEMTEIKSYKIEELTGYGCQQDTEKITICAEDVLDITPLKCLGQQEDLEKYGLSGQRSGTVTIERRDGDPIAFTLGDTSQSGTVGQYLLADGQVYIVPALSDKLLGSHLEFVSREVYSIPDWTTASIDENGEATEETMPDTLYSMTLSGAAFPEPITAEYVEKSRLNGYMLTSPILAESGTEDFEAIVRALKSVTANTVAAVGVTEEQLAQYGLQEPEAQVSFKLNEEEHTLKVSKKDSSNNRYLMADNQDVVYMLDNSRVKPWAEADLMSLRQSTICLANIADVEQLTLTREGDMVYDFTIDLQADTPTVKKPDGSEIAYEDYQSFFKQLISLAVFSLEDAPREGTPDLEVRYQYKTGTEDVLAFYPVEGQDRYACTLNGQFSGLVRGSEVAPLLESLSSLYGA